LAIRCTGRLRSRSRRSGAVFPRCLRRWRPLCGLRQTRLLDLAKKAAEARRVLEAGWREHPGLVLGLELARRMAAASDQNGTARVLAAVPVPESFHAGRGAARAAVGETARGRRRCSGRSSSVQSMLRNEALGADWRAAVLHDAVGAGARGR